MNDNLKYYLIYTLGYGVVLLMGEIIYRWLDSGGAWSRNFSHLGAGLISLPFPWLFASHWWVLILAVQSSLVLLSTRSLGLIPSHHKVAGPSLGSFLFFASIYLCFLVFALTGQKELFVIPILVLSISDVAAAVVGRSPGRHPLTQMKWPGKEGKTLGGSAAFFLSALLILFFSYQYLGLPTARSMLMALLISLAATLCEAFSPRGSDNLFIPLTILVFMQLGYIF